MKEIEVQIKLGTAYYYRTYVDIPGRTNRVIWIAHTSNDLQIVKKDTLTEFRKIFLYADAIGLSSNLTSNLYDFIKLAVLEAWEEHKKYANMILVETDKYIMIFQK